MPARRIGRPPLDPDSDSVNLTVRVSTRQYDELYAQARRERRTLSEVVRQSFRPLVLAKLDTDDDDGY
jgi:hypothetical protein